MLHDLFMVSEYFDGPAAAMNERDLVRVYGPKAVMMALSSGFLERKCVPCAHGRPTMLCVLSKAGLDQVMKRI